MNVAHITSVHPQNDNRIFYKECITLAKAGYEVTLIVAGGETKRLDGVNIVGYEKAKGGRLSRMIKTSLIDMIKACKRVDADVYHFHDPELIFTALYLKMSGKKVIYDIHENNPASILSKPYIKSKLQQKLISKLFDIFEKSVVRFFDAIVTARPDITKRFKHQQLITLRNFPILPDVSQIKRLEIKKEKPTVIYVGNMTKIRGLYELLDAFKVLNEYELWLLGPIGDKSLKEKIEKGVPNVNYLGVVEAYEVFSYIDAADIGIITFLPAPNHLETLATKPFEYMACGKPMIMSNFDYWKTTFQESSLYVDPSDSNEIAQTVDRLFKDKALMEKVSQKNRKLSQEVYNWKNESQKLLELYKRVL